MKEPKNFEKLKKKSLFEIINEKLIHGKPYRNIDIKNSKNTNIIGIKKVIGINLLNRQKIVKTQLKIMDKNNIKRNDMKAKLEVSSNM